MTETAVESTESVEQATSPSASGTSDEQLIAMLVDRARAEGLQLTGDGGLLPELKWRELLFIGAMRPEADAFVRDPTRFLPPFALGDLLPEGARFEAVPEGKRVRLIRL